ncbi:MAG: 16S rRNA (cytosine(1402)-N(4))-methyltransferase RsmH [Bacteroidia bacterium]|nr:16S rRNA (cytosine(1402)-N(4))-methyltransferase RsmH [Bacteroidia bacterium]
MSYHIPVLKEKSLEGLNIREDGTYVDVTFGGGGHSRAILERLGEKGSLIAFDQDADAEENGIMDERFRLVRRNFSFLEEELDGRQVQGILADLGVSSHQFDTPERGFSIRSNGPLDMRMDRGKSLSAEEIVNDYDEKELAGVLRTYGELGNARLVAGKIVAARKKGRIRTTGGLVEVIGGFVPSRKRNQFLAQTFQALRIEVNDELGVLKKLLHAAAAVTEQGGRLVVIAYHSLEDRMVKNYIRTGSVEGQEVKDLYGRRIAPFKEVHKGPVVPGEEEIEVNNRARSAKLRIAEKT